MGSRRVGLHRSIGERPAGEARPPGRRETSLRADRNRNTVGAEVPHDPQRVAVLSTEDHHTGILWNPSSVGRLMVCHA